MLDHAQTLREMAKEIRASEATNYQFWINEPDKIAATCEAGAAALERMCATCIHWHGPQKDAEGREQCTEPSISPNQMDEFMTLPDFGCTLHQPRGPK